MISRSCDDRGVQSDLDQALLAGQQGSLLEQVRGGDHLGCPCVELHLAAVLELILLLCQQRQLAEVPLLEAGSSRQPSGRCRA